MVFGDRAVKGGNSTLFPERKALFMQQLRGNDIMFSVKKITSGLVVSLLLASICPADSLSLYTELRKEDPNTGHGWDRYDMNWDWWQQDPCYPDPCFAHNWTEDVLYLCAFDGASGHDDYQPDSPTDGNVDGCYSTMYMGTGGDPTYQSLGVSGTDPNEFPNNQRDTRMTILVNLAKIKAVNSNAGAVLNCKFRWSIDYVMNWAGGSSYLQAPTKLYVSIFPAEKQQWWRHPPDSNSEPNTPIEELQNEFDGDPNTEKELDIRVDDGPWGPGLQPLTCWYIWIYGTQYYEMDFTEEIRQIMKVNPSLEWVGLSIRPSLDGEAVYLSMDAQQNLKEDPDYVPIPPTLDVQVSKYLGDLDDNGGVDFADFALFALQWKQSSGLLTADLNVDGVVDTADLARFCQNWLKGK